MKLETTNAEAVLGTMDLDLTKPDTARINDYWLGGQHNFEVDRIAAKRISTMLPTAPKWIQEQRAFQQRTVRYMAEVAHIDHFLVAGAGLPTCGNVHEVVPSARVLYTDINPVTIAYGQNIVSGMPNVRYVRCDATLLHELDPQVLSETFGEERRIGVIYIGVAFYLADATLRQALRNLYGFLAEGSHLAMSFVGRDTEKYAADILETYAKMGSMIRTHAKDEIAGVLEPWQPVGEGIVTTTAWGVQEAALSGDAELQYGCVSIK